jgi:hypothetical protein
MQSPQMDQAHNFYCYIFVIRTLQGFRIVLNVLVLKLFCTYLFIQVTLKPRKGDSEPTFNRLRSHDSACGQNRVVDLAWVLVKHRKPE